MFGLIRNIDFLIISILISVILLINSNRNYKTVSNANRSFTRTLVLMIISCSIEILVTVTRTYPHIFLPYVMHIMRSSYSIANGLLAIFVYIYARSYSGSFTEKKSWADYSVIAAGAGYVLISIIDIPTGIVTWFEEDGTYVHGPLYIITYAGVGVILLFAFVATIKDRRYYTGNQFAAINFLYGITAVATATEIAISSKVLLIMFGITVGLLIIYMSLESPDYAKAVAAKEEAERLRREADKANSAKSEFLARMSHEIRTPMNAIMGMNEMIINTTHEDQTRVYSSDAYNAANNLLDIINDILDFSRIESGKLELIIDKYSLSGVLRDLWIMFKAKSDEKGLTIEFEIDSELSDEYIGDRVRIRQILINLLNNAIKYTDEGNVLLKISKVSSEDGFDRVRYEVVDTGRGIREEDKWKLTEAFARIEEDKSTNIAGTGLGISITTSLLDMMDSKLLVESVYEKGSNFSFELKQEKAGDIKIKDYNEASSENVAFFENKAETKGRRILCVDDTPLNLKVFRAFLKDTASEIDLAESGKDALVLTKKKRYDLIFMDHLMPEMDGVECFNEIRKQENGKNTETPIIVLTANAIKGAREKYIEMGFKDALFKPYSRDALVKALNDCY